MKNNWLKFIIFFGIIGFDRLTKYLAVSYLTRSDLYLCPGFSFSLSYNTGIMCGLFSNYGKYIDFLLITLTILCLALLVNYYIKRSNDGYSTFGELIILAGGIGNLADRFGKNGVIDFIKISWNEYVFPIFNIADISITLGIIIIMYQQNLLFRR